MRNKIQFRGAWNVLYSNNEYKKLVPQLESELGIDVPDSLMEMDELLNEGFLPPLTEESSSRLSELVNLYDSENLNPNDVVTSEGYYLFTATPTWPSSDSDRPASSVHRVAGRRFVVSYYHNGYPMSVVETD